MEGGGGGSNFDVDTGLLSIADMNVLSQMEGTHTFSGWHTTQYKALESEHITQ